MYEPSERVRDGISLLARVAVGIVFIAHGWQKLFDWGIDSTTSNFTQMGIPLPGVSAWLAALIETFGGIALVLGLALPVVGVLLALDMLGALFLFHLPNGLFAADGGFELVLVLAAASLVLGFQGGQFTLARAFAGRRASTKL